MSTPTIISTELIIGLEVHVELATASKVFTGAGNPAGGVEAEVPNTLIDRVVLALPGTLPVMTRESIESSMLVGLSLGCEVGGVTHWDRKSYLYPDLPKGYQISQYDHPICRDGMMTVFPENVRGVVDLKHPQTVRILRAHLEEDAGKLMHDAPGGGAIDFSIVDYNRAGTPLLEIVTEPDLRSADEAVGFARQLRLLCRHLGVSACVMQEGQIRFEPNINMRLTLDDGSVVATPIVEVKNLNSFRSVRGAIEYEALTQPKRWMTDRREHAPGTKTTRGWDQDKGCTVEQRAKEDAHDYRYFPEPDLPPVMVDDEWVEHVRQRLVESPAVRLGRWVDDYGMDRRGAMALLEEPESCVYFDQVVREAEDLGVTDAGACASRVLLQVGARLANERGVRLDQLGASPEQVAGLLKLRADDAVSSAAAERVFALLCDEPGQDASGLAQREGLLTIRDDAAIDGWVDQILTENEGIVEQIRSGKAQAIGRLIGSVMKLSGGSADAADVKRRLLERINP